MRLSKVKLPWKQAPASQILPWQLHCGMFIVLSLVNIVVYVRSDLFFPRPEGSFGPLLIPRVSDEMSSVLTSFGYTLREEYKWHSIDATRQNLTFMTLFSGQARVCHDEDYMRWVLGPCIEGLTSMTFLLQDLEPANMAVEFPSYLDMCTSQISNLTRRSRCNVVVGQQSYMSDRTKGCLWPTNNALKFIALARSLEWSSALFPPHDYYVRARLDAPWCLPANVGPDLIALNQFWFLRSENLTSMFPSDRYALVPRPLTAYYFDSWKVWSPLDCDAHPLYMSNGNTSANQMNWRKEGEVVLSAHMNKNYDKFKWMRATWDGVLVGDPIVRHVNKTHIRFQRNSSAITYSSLLASLRKTSHCYLIEGGLDLDLIDGVWKHNFQTYSHDPHRNHHLWI
jgi:hypothetical protein